MIFTTAYRLAHSVRRLYVSEKPKPLFTEELHNKGLSSGSVVYKNTPQIYTNISIEYFKKMIPYINTVQKHYNNIFNNQWYILYNYIFKPYQLLKQDPQGTDCRVRRFLARPLLRIQNKKITDFFMMDTPVSSFCDRTAKKISPYNQAWSVMLSICSIYDLVQQKHKNGEKITPRDLLEIDTLRQPIIKGFAAFTGLLNKSISTMANNDSLKMFKPNKKVCSFVEMVSLIFITSKILEDKFLEPYIQHYYRNMASSSHRPTQAAEGSSTEMSTPQDRGSLSKNTNSSNLGSCSTSNQTPPTSSSEQSSTIGDVSIDTSSAFSPKELQNQKTGDKSQGKVITK